MARLDKILQVMVENGASDLHLVTGKKPALRIFGKLEYMEKLPVLEDAALRSMLQEIMEHEQMSQFHDTGDVDFSYSYLNRARFRVNYFEQLSGIGSVFRHIPSHIQSLDDLGMPTSLEEAAMLSQGLVLVTGGAGSGKSTTLSAMVNHANTYRRDHILTIEDPVEFVHQSRGCMVNHREVGKHTSTFGSALRAALREDPDIILVGELRDAETIALALEAASSGHLVFGTLPTQSASKSIDRIIDTFPPHQQDKIRVSLSESLKMVIAQSLLPRADQVGRCAALEVLVCTSAVSSMIREGKSYQLSSMMQTGKKHGMRLLDDSLENLLRKGWISRGTALEKASDKKRFSAYEVSEEFEELACA